ncbi:TolC family protein [Aliarcobacter cryaerophilus]|jgi:outer membrane protein|uniref:TolC family protein n=6 Tax=Arcobacteraceae TaxID=2808963 RepID=A0AAU0P0E5_9BACT|nr:TolC family protein [Aliarcobacter cryaerophilus]NCB11559.1 TolC family protein [Erysipelotrichia bacterium]WNL13159.1 TolC family protein [Arcobacter sp. AZ-2023]WPD02525.1 TolC family protein [Arcobacter sp. DSM 115972]WPD04545.1 TolC family protein [Arcobacter sp. DSM 115956]WPD06640.1 TolC family protein [Arcobacter sp. DSM 115955]WPD09644.1 TolC family protein [Arcobacter sp. DSM 115954]WPD11634.1 TolC family protein [Arcobacter sp. DSM 115960]
MKKIYFTFLVPIFLYSQNLEELVNLTIENRLVESSKQNLDALKDEYKSVQRGYLPKLDAGASYSINEHEYPNNPKKRANAYGSLNYLLYDGGKKYDIYDGYETNIKSGEKSLDALKNNLSLTVIQYYFDYLSLEAKKDAKQKEIEQLTAQEDRIGRFYNAGTTTEDELQKIVSRLQNAIVELQEIELNIITITHNLEYITGTQVSITDGSKLEDINNLIQKSPRFDIQALDLSTQSKQSVAQAQKSGYYPTITLDNTFNYYDNNYDRKINDTDINNHQNVASANMKWNLFSFGQTKYQYESKQKEYLASRSNFEYEKNKADVDLQLALKSYNIAKAKIKSTEATLKAAQSAYEIIKSKFENGLIDNVAFLQSLTEKYDAISQHKKAINDLEVKKATIIYHSGEKLQEYIR